MSKNLHQTVTDLYLLAQVADSEHAQKIYNIIERIQALGENDDEQNSIYFELIHSW